MHSPILVRITTCLLLLFLLVGCEEHPITEGLLKAKPADDNNDDPTNDLPFTGTYDGRTSTATITDENDARLMADSAYLVWHMKRLLQGMDNLVAVLAQRDAVDQSFNTEEVWSEGFGGVNCGGPNAVNLDPPGEAGSATFDAFCIQGINRTDNHVFTLEGEMAWEDAHFSDPGLGEDTPTTRTVTMEELSVTWRDQSFSLSGISKLDGERAEIQSILDVTHDDSGKEWRIVSTRVPGSSTTGERTLMVDSLGALTQITGANWVSPSPVCPDGAGAGNGQIRLRADQSGNEADFQVVLADCDQYNLLEAVDSSGTALGAGPWTILQTLWD